MRLDEAYANAAYIEGSEKLPEQWAEAAGALRRELGARAALDVAYGAMARQKMDLFRPKGTAKGLMIFVHGGYWRMTGKADWSHMARGALERGWAVCVPGYTLTPEAEIAQITDEITAAVQMAAARVDGPIALAGHSAGGHLAARMLERGRLGAQVAERLVHVMPISPVADLRPLLETSMNADFRLDLAKAEAESPVLMQDREDCPVTVWVGGDERPAFLDQARWLSEAWACPLHIEAGKHHFDVIEPLEDAGSAMLDRLLSGT